MAYTKQTWQDRPATTTPVSADRLNHLEDGIEDAATNADLALEQIADIDVIPPDGSITPAKLSFDPATQTELNAVISGLGSAAAASTTAFEPAGAAAAAVSALVAGAPGALDTLNELAAALDDDQNFAATISSELATLTANLAANKRTPQIQTVTIYGHSFTVITIGTPSTTLTASASVGATTITVASATSVQVGHRYVLRDAANYQNPEHVTVIGISGTTITLASPLTIARASGAQFIDPVFNCVHRVGKMLGDPGMFTNRGIGGAILMKGGATTSQGGFNMVMQLHPRPPGGPSVLGDPSPGVNFCVYGVNDISLVNGTTITTTAVVEANRHCTRSVQARFNLTVLYEAETAFPDSSILTAFSSGNAVVSGTTQNSGTGWRTMPSNGTATHSLPAAPTGVTSRIVDFCFIGNFVGGTIPASVITFTIDGTEVFPIGSNASGPYSSSNRFTTIDQAPPISGATGIPCVARLPVTGSGTHSIVATAGTGGAALDWIGYEADYVSPTIWTNICLTPGTVGTTGFAARVVAYNTMLVEVAAEFGAHVAVADMYGALSPGGTLIARAWSASIDVTHPNTYGNGLIAQALFDAYLTLELSGAAIANL